MAATLLVSPGPVQADVAPADARGCTLSDQPHRTCLDVDGSGTRVRDITVDHGQFGWLQNYRMKTWNVKGGRTTWTYTHSLIKSRAYGYAWITIHPNRNFPDPSYQYGRFYHGGAWVDGAPRITIHG